MQFGHCFILLILRWGHGVGMSLLGLGRPDRWQHTYIFSAWNLAAGSHAKTILEYFLVWIWFHVNVRNYLIPTYTLYINLVKIWLWFPTVCFGLCNVLSLCWKVFHCRVSYMSDTGPSGFQWVSVPARSIWFTLSVLAWVAAYTRILESCLCCHAGRKTKTENLQDEHKFFFWVGAGVAN